MAMVLFASFGMVRNFKKTRRFPAEVNFSCARIGREFDNSEANGEPDELQNRSNTRDHFSQSLASSYRSLEYTGKSGSKNYCSEF